MLLFIKYYIGRVQWNLKESVICNHNIRCESIKINSLWFKTVERLRHNTGIIIYIYYEVLL